MYHPRSLLPRWTYPSLFYTIDLVPIFAVFGATLHGAAGARRRHNAKAAGWDSEGGHSELTHRAGAEARSRGRELLVLASLGSVSLAEPSVDEGLEGLEGRDPRM